jgi:GT2 family glycosyltransferase
MPNRNNAHVLDLVLERLAVHTTYSDVELVVVDDGSTDASLEILRRWRDSGRFRRFRLLEREHSGVIETLNAGLHAATGELVVQLDGDASIETPDWLQRMVAFFRSDERIGVVTAKVVMDDGLIHACGVNVIAPEGMHDRGTTLLEPVGQRTLHTRVRRLPEAQVEGCDRIVEVDGGIGCCMMYRRDVALEVGGYDPGFAPVWFDDLDLTLTIRRYGKKVFFLPDVRVVHHINARWGPSAVSLPRRAIRAGRRRAGLLVPPAPRERLGRALGLDQPAPEHLTRLRGHYAYWARKWGFDFLNPDMDEVRALYGSTEVCWATDPALREDGERIVARFRQREATQVARA